ncbi:hypothetical protein ACQY0O_003466 [Thecaphora frezii]
MDIKTRATSPHPLLSKRHLSIPSSLACVLSFLHHDSLDPASQPSEIAHFLLRRPLSSVTDELKCETACCRCELRHHTLGGDGRQSGSKVVRSDGRYVLSARLGAAGRETYVDLDLGSRAVSDFLPLTSCLLFDSSRRETVATSGMAVDGWPVETAAVLQPHRNPVGSQPVERRKGCGWASARARSRWHPLRGYRSKTASASPDASDSS